MLWWRRTVSCLQDLTISRRETTFPPDIFVSLTDNTIPVTAQVCVLDSWSFHLFHFCSSVLMVLPCLYLSHLFFPLHFREHISRNKGLSLSLLLKKLIFENNFKLVTWPSTVPSNFHIIIPFNPHTKPLEVCDGHLILQRDWVTCSGPTDGVLEGLGNGLGGYHSGGARNDDKGASVFR